MDSFEHQLIGNRYQLLNKLGSGGMGAVYRAFDRFKRHPVALKRVLTDPQEPGSTPGAESSTDTRVALAHEFQTLASLHHPHVINVLDYGFDDQQQPYFTMNLLDSPKTLTFAGQDQPLAFQIKLLVQMLQALAYLHRRGIIHRDLKPDNALVSNEGDVKVLDFGLAALREQKPGNDELSGTLAYMAPEVLQGSPASEAADLYAVGVMAYELFAGRHPFDVTNIGHLIQAVIYEPPNLLPLEVDYSIKSIVERLLAKQPQDRFRDAYDVIAELTEAADLPMPKETAAIRESFLQAAQFVGREKETAQLSSALAQAIDGKGSGWLVGGESGVGKSRLLDELRTRALVKGALVLHGQAVSEGGMPYQTWQEPLRRLALSTELDDKEAGILKQIIPDVGDLLERPIPDAPELEGQAGQQRLLNTIAALFRKQQQPVVVILEDLQWITESLDVVKHLLPIVGDLRLLLIGNYRDDEKPDLPNDLPGMQVIKLERLDDTGIAQLSVSMLGETGRQPEVLRLLKKETEGNVFFLVEVVRALAEDAGHLSNIGRTTLPPQVFAGGVQTVVERRLQRVPENARALLRAAAVSGRLLDLEVLRAIDPKINLDDWLSLCANAAVLDILNERWRFAHDKLREGLLSVMSDQERIDLHKQVAAALEKVYAETPDEQAAIISEHYEQAGERALAADWHIRAGKHARNTFAPESAINYYRKVLAFWANSANTNPASESQQVQVYKWLGEMLNWQAQYEEAARTFAQMRTVAESLGDRLALAHAWHGIAATHMYQGDFKSALESITHSEDIARADNVPLELARALYLKGWSQLNSGNTEEALKLGEEVLALSDQHGYLAHTADSLNLLGVVHATLGQYHEAVPRFERALRTFQELGDRVQVMFMVNNLGVVAERLGDAQGAFDRYQEAITIAHEIGHRNGEMLYLSNLGEARIRLGDYAAAEADLRQLIDIAESVSFAQLPETYRFLAEAYLGQGKTDEALEAAQTSLKLGQATQAQGYLASTWRVLGQITAQLGKPAMIEQTTHGQSTSYAASACFEESLRICKELGMEGERAQTLRAWASYELKSGDAARGAVLWQEARDLFTQIGAPQEAERMAELPVVGKP